MVNNWQQIKMKKIFMLLAILVALPLCAFSPNESNDQCYKVKIHVRIIMETRTAYTGGTVITSKVINDDKVIVENVCAESENHARRRAESNCSSMCSRSGNYVRKTTVNGEDAYVFEVREITSIEIVGSCGNC